MYYPKFRAGISCTTPGHILVYSRAKFGTVTCDSGPMSPLRMEIERRLSYLKSPYTADSPGVDTVKPSLQDYYNLWLDEMSVSQDAG